MRYVRIFLLHLQSTFAERARSFVWFLMSLLNPLMLLLFWRGEIQMNNSRSINWSLTTITSYYFLQIIVGSMLMSHTEDDVARRDIEEGNLAAYLLRPFSYYGIKLLNELSYRILQGGMGILVLIIFYFFFGNFLTIANSPLKIFLSIIIAILAFIVSFTYKMVLGIVAFWLTDIGGIFQLSEMLIFIFAGYIIPLSLFPSQLQQISYLLPYGYIIYFPIVAFQGKLTLVELLQVIGMQLVWAGILFGLYKFLWKRGIRKFSGVGQ